MTLKREYFAAIIVIVALSGCVPVDVTQSKRASSATATTSQVNSSAGTSSAPRDGGTGTSTQTGIGSVAAFQQTLYPLVRGQVAGQGAFCYACHTSQAPAFANADVTSSHNALVNGNYVNFVDAGASRIVQYVNSGHNCWSNCAADAQTIMQLIQQWAARK